MGRPILSQGVDGRVLVGLSALWKRGGSPLPGLLPSLRLLGPWGLKISRDGAGEPLLAVHRLRGTGNVPLSTSRPWPGLRVLGVVLKASQDASFISAAMAMRPSCRAFSPLEKRRNAPVTRPSAFASSSRPLGPKDIWRCDDELAHPSIFSGFQPGKAPLPGLQLSLGLLRPRERPGAKIRIRAKDPKYLQL